MSGRGSYSGRNSGSGSGRSGNRSGSQNNKNGKPKASTEESKKKYFEPYSAGRNASTYTSVLSAITACVKTDFADAQSMITAICDGTYNNVEPVKPVLNLKSRYKQNDDGTFQKDHNDKLIPKDDEEQEKSRLLNEEKKMVFQDNMRVYNNKKKQYDDNKIKLYSIIFEKYCSKAMQNRIEERINFKSDIRDDPIKSLETIKQTMYVPTRSKYVYDGIIETIKQIFDMKQSDDENIVEYSKRFKQALDEFKATLGKQLLDHYTKNTEEYQNRSGDTKKKEIKEKNWNSFITLMFIKNSDQRKYGELVKGLKSQYSLGNDQYPKNMDTAIKALNSHKWDSVYLKFIKEKHQNKNKQKNDKDKEESLNPGTNLAQLK